MPVSEIPARPWPAQRVIPPLGEELPAGTVVVSADSHWVEPDDWAEAMPAKFRDRAPRGWRDENGDSHFEADGKSLDSPGFPTEMNSGRPGARDPIARLADLDADGVDKEMLFPHRTLGLLRTVGGKQFGPQLADGPDYIAACFDAYNRLLARYSAVAPERLYGIALLNYWDPAATTDAIAEINALGFRAMTMPSLPPNVHYNSRAMEPLWDAIEASGIPLSFHVGESFDSRGLGGLATSMMVSFQPFRRLWSLLTFSGVLERHPSLRVVFAEGGISWVPSALFDADKLAADYESILQPRLGEPPSFYWRRQCAATFQADPRGLEQIDAIGWENALWASDYPHAEGTLGYSRETVRDVFRATTVEKAQAIVGGNALRILGLGST
jgi:predicted TIM-barrel fold metal-dependent hydrolase